MRIIQFDGSPQGPSLGVVRGDHVYNLTQRDPALSSVAAAFRLARSERRRLEDFLRERLDGGGASENPLSYRELLAAGRVLPPVTEDGGRRILVSGTGLTHLGSVKQRDTMHRKEEAGPKSDSRKMFEMGLDGGRPPGGQRGAAPEWFYKGDGRILRGPMQPLDIPPFAPDGGEEPEIVAIYIVDDNGVPCRLGFTQGNEWSDHVTENINYLLLAPSKLRVCAIGPELVTDLPFDDVRGRCRVLRGNDVLYDSGELLTGEKHMSHSLANLEDHHFKFPQHRQPGDIHVHFLGTSKLSFQHRRWQYETGDLIEVSFEGFAEPLRNPVHREPPSDRPIIVEPG